MPCAVGKEQEIQSQAESRLGPAYGASPSNFWRRGNERSHTLSHTAARRPGADPPVAYPLPIPSAPSLLAEPSGGICPKGWCGSLSGPKSKESFVHFHRQWWARRGPVIQFWPEGRGSGGASGNGFLARKKLCREGTSCFLPLDTAQSVLRPQELYRTPLAAWSCSSHLASMEGPA